MSELKAYRFLGQDEVWPDANFGSDYYLKSEADKVIAHQKRKRCEAMADFCSYKAWYFKKNGQEYDFFKWMNRRRVWVKLYRQFTDKEANDGND